jgi:transposase
MLKVEDWMDIHLLKKQGYSNSEIGRLTGHSRNTVAKMLATTAEQAHTRSYKKRSSRLDEFKPYLKSRYEQYQLSAVRLLAEIKPMGYTGSVDLVRRYLQTLKPLSKAVEKATLRYETPPGEQAQVDWAYCGRFLDPNGETVPSTLSLWYSVSLECSMSSSSVQWNSQPSSLATRTLSPISVVGPRPSSMTI